MKPSLTLYVVAVFWTVLGAASTGLGAGVARAAENGVKFAHEVSQPEAWKDDLALAQPVDINPDPHVLEIELEAQIRNIEFLPGRPTPAWTYGGTVPGPLIRVRLGDRIIVHFRNSLPEATSIHWHGLRVPNNMDGVPNVTQDPVPAGGEFTYDFVAKDAGTFWYHPHINSADQVGWGMYGPLVVEDPDDPAFGDELVLVLSDMDLMEDGQFRPAGTGGGFETLFGREGSVLLVNGKVMPRLKVRAGKQQRWRIINAARSRYFGIGLRGHELVRLGGDRGLAEYPTRTNKIVVVPSERADIVFTPSDEPGSVNILRWIPADRGYGSTFNRLSEPLMEIETVALPRVKPDPVPDFRRQIVPIDTADAVERRIELTIKVDGADVEMGINGVPYRSAVPIEAHVGETDVWRIVNNTDFAHPFHVHGYSFQILDDGRPLEWKDSTDVPAHSEIRIALNFDERPGTWMYHCHILDHAEAGMMGLLHVAPGPR